MKKIYKILVVGALVFSLFAVKTSFAAPTLIVDPATSISSNSATFSAFYNANGETLSGAMFKYGTDPLMTQTVYSNTPTSSSGVFTANVSGLTPSTTYYFKAVLVSSAGVKESVASPFTTLSTPGGGGGGNTNACVINSFTANQSSVTAGSSVVLSWNASNCNSFSINPGNLSSSLNSGSVNVVVNSTTVYTITASGPNGNATRNLTVTVGSVNPPTGTCVINSFTASSSNVTAGSPVTLTWNTSNCSYINFGQTGGGSYPAVGSVMVYVNASSTYTLHAYGTSNNDTRSVTITVSTNPGSGCGNNCHVQPPQIPNTCPWYHPNCFAVTCSNCFPNSQNNNLVNNSYQQYTQPQPQVNNNQNLFNSFWNNDNAFVQNNPNINNDFYSEPRVSNVLNNERQNTTVVTRAVYNVSDTIDLLKNNQSENSSDVDNVNNGNNLAAGVGYSAFGFFPGTLIGWLIFILLILVIVLVVRRYSEKNK
jgi:hypothetical protein